MISSIAASAVAIAANQVNKQVIKAKIAYGSLSPCCEAPTESDNRNFDQMYCTKCDKRV